MGAGVAVAAYDQAAGQAQAKFRPNHMDDALPRLVDIEHLDAAGSGLDPQGREQLLPDLDRAGAATRRRYRVIRRRERQFRIVNPETAAFQIEQAARAAEVMQQMAVDMEEIGIIADPSDDMLLPDLGQHCATGLFQGSSSLRLLRPASR